MREIILLGDSVVYRDDIKGFDDVGVVTESCINNFKVMWSGESKSRTEIYERLRPARLDEVDAQSRVIRDADYD
ncbi:phosphohistidine phosphatase [Acinetobacter sp. YH12140]|uniref:phosphohistidine phosphatase n=1 Tax=Acinetobacter sp. YH12140 TaxID=2601124 RepID=UPI0015D30AA9|nr:phosphohistidine phosphatase [Acinetobacter sp. YH12140]